MPYSPWTPLFLRLPLSKGACNKAITGRPRPVNISGFFGRQGEANGSLSGDSFRLAFSRFFSLFIITITSYYFYFYFSSSLSRLFLLRYKLLFLSLGDVVGLPGEVGEPVLVRGYPLPFGVILVFIIYL